MTTPEMHTDELAAGTEALKTMIAEILPAWQQAMVPQGMLDKAVAAVVAAVDKVRDEASAAS